MLIPFDRNLMHIENFSGNYIFSVVNDMFRFEKDLSGYILCISGNHIGYLFFKNNKLQNALAFLFSGGVLMPQPQSFRIFTESEDIDLYANIIEEPVVADNVYKYFFSLYSMHAPYELSNSGKILEYLITENYTGMIAFTQGFIINMAYFEKGKFKYFQYYHPDTKSYANDRNPEVFKHYMASLKELTPVIALKDYKAKNNAEQINESFIKEQKDSIVNTLLFYFDILDIIINVMLVKTSKETVYNITKKIFDELRVKYTPLYEKLYFSMDSETVNWSVILEDRKFIPIKYKFEHYHLYIDEILKNLVSALYSIANDDGLKLLRAQAKNCFTHTEKDDLEIKKVILRFEQLFEKVK